MNALYQREGAKERIEAAALQLSGLVAAPEAREALFSAAVASALNLCGREDVPEMMEPALAQILAGLYLNGMARPVSAVKRGDTAITYTSGGVSDTSALLSPFIKLRTAR